MTQKMKNNKNWLSIICIGICVAIGGAVVTGLIAWAIFASVYLFLFRPVRVVGDTMAPKYKNNEYLLARVTRNNTQFKRGDVIILRTPTNPNVDYIKRIIGIPGDKININEGKVFLNGKVLNEPYVTGKTNFYTNGFMGEGKEVIVPTNEYFVLGDNRPQSTDSREFGFVPKENLINIVMFCYWNCN